VPKLFTGGPRKYEKRLHIKILKVAIYKPPTKKSIRNNDNINL
tara:strand:- start:281 stop:409 length:129 start_codon:yes stop_codon:yes gene_type:complete